MKVPLTIDQFLDRASLAYGRRVGIVDEPNQPARSLGTLSYGQVGALAAAQASGLDQLGIESGQRVAIVSKNAARLLISFFGVSGYGRILVPITFRLQAEEIQYIVDHSGASILLVDKELDASLSQVKCQQRIVLDDEGDALVYKRDSQPLAWQPDEDATATINYTSGTTARPKGVQLTHRNLWINASTLGLHAGVSHRDVYLHTLPMFHCNGWGMPFILSAMGAKQVVLRQVDGDEILRRIDQHGVTLLCGAPTVAAMILDAARRWNGPPPGQGRVRMVVAGAAPPTQVIERLETQLGWEFIQIYGLTETAPLLTINQRQTEDDALSANDRAKRLGRAGLPALGVSIDVDHTGEVLARGNVVMKGYWNAPQESQQALEGDWFHTGDGGNIDEENQLHIRDRKKDVIITGGENVSSLEVEDTLFSHPAVLEVAVIGVPDEKWGETVKALVVLQPDQPSTPQQLIDHCRKSLAHFKCPTSVEFREQLPRTATGKLQKYRLRQSYWDH